MKTLPKHQVYALCCLLMAVMMLGGVYLSHTWSPMNLAAVEACDTIETTNLILCEGTILNENEGLTATCPTCPDGSSAETINWWSIPDGGTLTGSGSIIVGTGAVLTGTGSTSFSDFDEGSYTFYAQCTCTDESGEVTCSSLEPAYLEVIDCECDAACMYVLVLEDSGNNGWDAASIDVSINEAPPDNYKITAQQMGLAAIPICINDGGILDFEYWNGAFESEHSWYVLDPNGNIATDVNGNSVHYETNPPAGERIRIKADCPNTTCENQEEAFIISVLLGDNPDGMGWELTSGTGSVISSSELGDYGGMLAGTIVNDTIFLDLCDDYVFNTTGHGSSWHNGDWSILTQNIAYGTAILDQNHPHHGNMELLTGTGTVLVSNMEFTLPCPPECVGPIELTGASLDDCSLANLQFPVPEPSICSPNCSPTSLDSELRVAQFVVDPVLYETVYTIQNTTSYQNQDHFLYEDSIAVGQYWLITKYTYCDDVMVRCTSQLNIVANENPAMVCNDHVVVSLRQSDGIDDNESGCEDDLGECTLRIRPDMILEMPSICEGEYIVTLFDEFGDSLTVNCGGIPDTLPAFLITYDEECLTGTGTIIDSEDCMTGSGTIIDSDNPMTGTGTIMTSDEDCTGSGTLINSDYPMTGTGTTMMSDSAACIIIDTLAGFHGMYPTDSTLISNCNPNTGTGFIIYSGGELLNGSGSIITSGADIEPAHDLVGVQHIGRTIFYNIRHIYSNNQCWGRLTVEDKSPPVLECFDYEIACTHPHIDDIFYAHQDNFETGVDLPHDFPSGTLSDPVSTFVPINIECSTEGEVVQSIEIGINLRHRDIKDIELYLHLPSGLVNAGCSSPILLADNGDAVMNGVYVAPSNESMSNNGVEVAALDDLIGKDCGFLETVLADTTSMPITGTGSVATSGDTWYIEVLDNNENNSAIPPRGGTIRAVDMDIKCGFPDSYEVYDCNLDSVYIYSQSILETHCDHSEWAGAKLSRIWHAVDGCGNLSACTQTINLLAPTFADIVAPQDTIIECNSLDSLPLPEFTGTFEYGCYPLDDTNDHRAYCDMTYTYDDLELPSCGSSYKIIRTWTLVNWCTGTTKKYTQLIKVEDTTPPELAVDDITIYTNEFDCMAGFIMPDSLIDDCSGVAQAWYTYRKISGVNQQDTTIITIDITNDSLFLERNTVPYYKGTFSAVDSCGNESSQRLDIHVADTIAPTAVCNYELHLSLGTDLPARLYAEDIDEGSNDNCTINKYEVRRISGCLGTSDWDDYVELDCCDVDEEVYVELRVTDGSRNRDTCFMRVLVEDLIPPTMECPPNDTLYCDEPIGRPYAPIVWDNCDAALELEMIENIDTCGQGYIRYNWTVSDGSSKSNDQTCTQEITILHRSDFIVRFPKDTLIHSCSSPEATGVPIISNVGCGLMEVLYDDQHFELVTGSGSCIKTERTWQVFNQCIYEHDNENTPLGIPLDRPLTYQDDGDGYFEYVQTIAIIDTVPPILECPDSLIVIYDETPVCRAAVSYPLVASDDCTPDSLLRYYYEIDFYQNGHVDLTGDWSQLYAIFPYGKHYIHWEVVDVCGNSTTCTVEIEIVDALAPTVVCTHGLSINLGENTSVELWANDFVAYAYDNCSSSAYVESTVMIKRIDSLAVLDTLLELTCEDEGLLEVEIWVHDGAFNEAFCTTYVLVQDHDDLCPDTGTGSMLISGDLYTEYGEDIQRATVTLESDWEETQIQEVVGNYTFDDLYLNSNYTISVSKDIYPLNGVSTYDLVLMSQHILGIKELDSPYQRIAADINNDGYITTFDIIQARQMILYVITDFPNNTSWRFVAADYIFPNPLNPWEEPFPELHQIAPLVAPIEGMNFIGVKVGDVSGNASMEQ